MRKLIFALVAAGVMTYNVSGYSSEDSTVTSRPDLNNKPGRTIDEDTVKSNPNPNKPGRTIDGDTVKSNPNPNKPGRTIDGDTVKSDPHPDKPGRTLEQTN